MAANNSQDVELRIRATNYTKQTTDKVVDALKEMTKAQDAQIESAKKGTTTAAQLEASYNKIESAAKALLSQQSLTKLFEAQSATLSDLQTKLEAARKAQQNYANSLTPGEERTKAQQAEMNRLGKAIASVEKQYERAQGRVDTTAQRMAAFGITASNLADSQQKIVAAVNQANAALERQERAINSVDSDAARRKAQADAIAQREQQVRVDNVFAQAERDVANALKAERDAQLAANAAAAQSQREAQARADAIFSNAERQAAEALRAKAAAQQAANAAAAQANAEAQTRADIIFTNAERQAAEALRAKAAAQQAANAAADQASMEAQLRADIVFTNAEREATEAINRKNAALRMQQQALQQAADAAERMSRSTVVTARGKTPVLTPQLSQQIRDIQNPADAAVRSITGIEDAVGRLETRVSAIRGPIRDYRGAMEDAKRTQQALLAVAGQVDTYQNQIAALRAARYEYTQNRTAVNNLIAAMRSGNGGDDIATRLASAQRTLQQSAQALGNITTATRQTQATLRAAGVDTANLGAAEQQLVQQTNRATQAINSLNDAYRRNGAAAENAGSRVLSFFGGDGGRTTLSYAQRLRGELLSLAAGFVGLNAAIELGKKTLEAYNQTQAVMNRLLVVNGGNAKAAAADFLYLQSASDRIGVSFTKIAPAYSKFAIAAKQAGQTSQQTRYIFEGFAVATSRLGLSAVESERVFKAIEQMFNKGKVSAEELSQQLGDALPGAYNLFAKAANMTTQDFAKAMEQGQIAPSLLIKVAKELKDTYGAVGNGVENLSQSQARFDNAFNRFLNNTANGGFVKAYQQLLNKLSSMLSDGTADKFATQLSQAFVAVLNVLEYVIDNFDGFKRIVEAVIALKLIGWLFSLPAAFIAVRTEVVALQGSMVALNAWMARTEAAAAMTAALGTGGVAGVVARLTPLVLSLARAFIVLSKASVVVAAGYAAYQGTSAVLDMMDNGIRERIVGATNAATKAFQDAADARKKLDANTDKDQQGALQRQYDKLRDIAVKSTKEQARLVAEAQAKGVNFDAKVNYALAQQRKAEDTSTKKNTGETAYPGDPDDSATKLATLKKNLANEDKKSDRAMKEQRLRTAKEELDERLAIIREPFEEMRKQQKGSITDEKKYQEAMTLINASEGKAVAAERAKFNNEQAAKAKEVGDRRVKLAQEVQDKLGAIEADIANKNAKADPTQPYEERRAARIEKIGHAYDELNRKIIEEKKVAPAQAAADKLRLDLLTKERQILEGENSDRDEANRLADEFNAKQTILQNRLAEIKTLYDSGKLSSEQFLDQTNYAVATLGPGVEEAGQAALNFAAGIKSIMDPVAYSNLVATVRAGMAKADTDASIATNNLNAQQTTLNQILEQQQRDIDLIQTKRKLGIIDSTEEAALLNANADAYKSKITANVDEMLRLLATARDMGAISQEAFDKASAGANKLKLETVNAHAASSDLDKTIVNSIATNGVQAFQTLSEHIAKVATGAEGIGEGFRGALSAVGSFFASFLAEIAQAIIKQLILNALVKAFGAASGIGGAAASAGGTVVAAAGAHRGAVMGQSRTFTRSVAADMFTNAVRYHTGGIVGLAPNEMPAILEKNEEVLTRDDPRHVLNGGRAAAAPADGGAGNRFVLVDDRARVPEAMASSEGEKVTMVHLKRNIATIKQWIK